MSTATLRKIDRLSTILVCLVAAVCLVMVIYNMAMESTLPVEAIDAPPDRYEQAAVTWIVVGFGALIMYVFPSIFISDAISKRTRPQQLPLF